jgi:hypothetical protein
MPLGRRGRPLMRAAARTSVATGTAGAVHHRQQQRWDRKEAEAYQTTATQQQLADQQAQLDQLQQQQYAPPPQQYAPPPQQYAPPPAESPTVAQLNQLSQLHAAGVLSDEEFAAAKQKVLSGG